MLGDKSHKFSLFIPHLEIVVHHSITSHSLCPRWQMSQLHVTLLPLTGLWIDTPLYCCVLLMPFRKLPLCLFTSLTLKSAETTKCFHATAIFLYSTALCQGTKQVTCWWEACFLCSTERTIRLLLNLGFPCWLTKKHFHDFFISFTAIKGWSLEFFPSLYFNFFFVLPSQTALESKHAHLFQMEIILRLRDMNPSECVDRSSLWVSLLVLSIYFHLNQLSLKTHKTWSSAMCVFHYEKSWAHIVDISLTASLQMLIWTC